MVRHKKKKRHTHEVVNNNDTHTNNTTSSLLQDDEISNLQLRIKEMTPPRGTVPPLGQKVSFRALPLSEATMRGLEGRGSDHDTNKKKGQQSKRKNDNSNKKNKKFVEMTDIQNACIPHALAGRDVLGAARTGSGKTLAFLIPLLELLHRNQYIPSTGPGALVLSPTRELAVQIFEVLRSIGIYHPFSAGLLVGGKKEFHLEQMHIGKTNIIIATPGRMLQHFEQTVDLDTSSIIMLVLDEADRILDMGFREQMVRILDYIPSGPKLGGLRQTLLFSATQTKRVADLASLSLDSPEYIGVHDKEKDGPTPVGLQQNLVVLPLEHKLNAVYSFLRSHLNMKIIVFFASCSQVRHAWEVFCALQPGIPVLCLHGKLLQERRTKIYFDYMNRPSAVLFATDVAARGLDFPNVDWVIQIDSPEDLDMYIHRVGRTARYNKGGKSLLCVLPSEVNGMMKLLKNGNVPIKKLTINPSKTVTVTNRAAGLLASRSELNAMAKKAFKSYVRSVHLMPNKDIFHVKELDLENYATSLGLSSTPSVRFLKEVKDRKDVREKKNVNFKLHKLKEQIKAERLAKKIAKMGGGESAEKVVKKEKEKRKTKRERDVDDDDGEGLLVVKRKRNWNNKNEDDDDEEEEEQNNLPDVHLNESSQSRHPKKIRIDVSNTNNKRIIFNDDGEVDEEATGFMKSQISTTTGDEEMVETTKEVLENANEEYMRKVRERLRETKELDKMEEKDRIREKHKKRRNKERGEKQVPVDDDDDVNEEKEHGVILGSGNSVDDSEDESEDEEEEGKGHGRENESSSSSSLDSDEGSSNNADDSGSSSSSSSEGEDEENSERSDDDDESSEDDDDDDSDDDDDDIKAKEELALMMLRSNK